MAYGDLNREQTMNTIITNKCCDSQKRISSLKSIHNLSQFKETTIEKLNMFMPSSPIMALYHKK